MTDAGAKGGKRASQSRRGPGPKLTGITAPPTTEAPAPDKAEPDSVAKQRAQRKTPRRTKALVNVNVRMDEDLRDAASTKAIQARTSVGPIVRAALQAWAEAPDAKRVGDTVTFTIPPDPRRQGQS